MQSWNELPWLQPTRSGLLRNVDRIQLQVSTHVPDPVSEPGAEVRGRGHPVPTWEAVLGSGLWGEVWVYLQE